MRLQVFQIFRNPVYIMVTMVIMVGYFVMLLFFDQFVFFQPYFVVYVPVDSLGLLSIDLALSVLTGFVAAVSIHEIKSNANRAGGAMRAGLIGVLAAVFAGACPCYYLAPMLAAAGGFGGVLGLTGIFFSVYQTPIKLVSIIILLAACYGLEKAARTKCMLT
ncbi:MAG: hypothetical protein ACLPY5_11895 [Candidatus Bathyarchaeia archaeon]